ncbi:hypothetical protein EZV62_008640 [Acer yangbiense]|uniref:Glyoxal oxidase N-terminal domain-containing protein n=1 Tax=Acer yangbiense TaxID=1000413 RepID=A0A5C7IEF0_9ROSI|nr:hypothetical protein EZV62_008640 [Acer yangbiense]
MPDGSRNYPSSAMSALLPIKLHVPNPNKIKSEALICRGARQLRDVLMINGAKMGTAGWDFADDPNTTPVLYKPDNPKTQQFTELTATTIHV